MNDKEQYKTYFLLQIERRNNSNGVEYEMRCNEFTELRPSYRQVLDALAENVHILYGCRTIDGMTLLIADEIATHIDNARQEIERRYPCRQERDLWTRCMAFDDTMFAAHWDRLHPYLYKRYTNEELNIPFYLAEFATIERDTYSAIRLEFLSDWDCALLRKEITYELEILNSLRYRIERYIVERIKSYYGCTVSPTELNLLWGMNLGKWQTRSIDLLQTLSAVCKNDSGMQQLFNTLGRRDEVQSRRTICTAEHDRNTLIQFTHATHSDIDGICESNRLDALLPTEVALLKDTSLELTFYKKYVERRLQTFDFHSHAPSRDQSEKGITVSSGPGPYIVCLDTSSSMSGRPEEIAKAICYGLLLRARAERRACYLIFYSVGIEVLDISDWERDLQQIIDFLTGSFSGGTDLEQAVTEALRILGQQTYTWADLLVVSDFEVRDLSDETISAMNAAKNRDIRFHSLLIGRHGNFCVLDKFDRQWTYDHRKHRIIGPQTVASSKLNPNSISYTAKKRRK